MIDSNDDVKWVASQRPPVVPPDSETTKRVRASLLAHAENSTHLVALSQPSAPPSKRRVTGFLKGHRRLACLRVWWGVGCRSGSRSLRSSSISKAKRSRVTCAATFPPTWSSTPITPGPSLSPERPVSACEVETWPWRFLTWPAMTLFSG